MVLVVVVVPLEPPDLTHFCNLPLLQQVCPTVLEEQVIPVQEIALANPLPPLEQDDPVEDQTYPPLLPSKLGVEEDEEQVR